ncbi:MAG: hypothetical protein EOP62_04080 [Sphingomonadales bacterium]|nr:MAG: hypothetical protein EOP62_04080 [Sphingomonadales bacterium]
MIISQQQEVVYMRAYRATSIEGFDVTVFAESVDEAAGAFHTHYEAVMGRAPPQFTVGRVRRPKPGMKRRHLAEALARGISGIGYMITGRGWTVIAPDLVVALVPQPA